MKKKYPKVPRNIRFDDHLIAMAVLYQKKNNVTFSNLVRIALGSFLTRKLHKLDIDEWDKKDEK
jgi:hypothetical protein